MSIISPNIKMLMKSIMVSENAIVGSVKGAESTLKGILTAISETEITIEEVSLEDVVVTTEERELIEKSAHKILVQQLPSVLVALVKKDLEDHIPDESQIKNWFLYDEDFSGITFYYTNNGELTFASIARGVDLSSGYQYADNRYEAKSYSDAHCSGDVDKIQIAESALKANLPGKKIKYCHWVGNKPSKQGVKEFQVQNSQYFA
tara:strand:+ start:1899 stop:2513 length:615 start_codon:yes stop_codon:yes gene_type:complete